MSAWMSCSTSPSFPPTPAAIASVDFLNDAFSSEYLSSAAFKTPVSAAVDAMTFWSVTVAVKTESAPILCAADARQPA